MRNANLTIFLTTQYYTREWAVHLIFIKVDVFLYFCHCKSLLSRDLIALLCVWIAQSLRLLRLPYWELLSNMSNSFNITGIGLISVMSVWKSFFFSFVRFLCSSLNTLSIVFSFLCVFFLYFKFLLFGVIFILFMGSCQQRFAQVFFFDSWEFCVSWSLWFS